MRHEFRSLAVGIVLLGAGAGYPVGVVGPPVRAISNEFDVSLAAVGLLTSVLFAGIVALNLVAPLVERRLGLRTAVRLAPVLTGAGGVICAAAPSFGVLVAGRALVGVGVGVSLVLVPVVGRAVGGAWLIGLYGAAITVAVALALLVGGVFQSAGLDWRVSFAVSAALGLAPLAFLLGRFPATERSGGRAGRDLVAEFARPAYWRVALLFVVAVSLPFVMGSWIVHYLTLDDAMSAGAAGVVGFLLFAAAAIGRPAGGRIDQRRHAYLLAAMPFVAAAGFALLALDNDPAVAVPAIVVLGVAFSIPYAVSYIRSTDLVPAEPTVGLSAELLTVNAVPVLLTPLFGVALERGHATAAWLALGGIAVLAGLANLPRAPAR